MSLASYIMNIIHVIMASIKRNNHIDLRGIGNTVFLKQISHVHDIFQDNRGKLFMRKVPLTAEDCPSVKGSHYSIEYIESCTWICYPQTPQKYLRVDL